MSTSKANKQERQAYERENKPGRLQVKAELASAEAKARAEFDKTMADNAPLPEANAEERALRKSNRLQARRLLVEAGYV